MKRTFLSLLLIIMMVLFIFSGCGNESNDKIKVPGSSGDYEGRDYEEVVSELQEAGFTNIKTEELGDLITGWLDKEESVKEIDIEGVTTFSTDSKFKKDAKIVIAYHTFPKKEGVTPKDNSVNIYDDTVGKPAIDAYSELKNLGYIVNFKHTTTKMDFTEEVLNSNSETQWIITDVDSYDENSKTVSFLVNTREMIDETQRQNEATDSLNERLDAQHAWQEVECYGKQIYPYGFNLKWVKGRLSQAAEDDTWFLKAECEVKNENGKWMKNLTCEAYVTGTTESPQVIDFAVY